MRALAVTLLLAAAPPAPAAARAAAQPAPAAVTAAPLRVCADPNNLPFSNDRREGFENALAQLVATELARPLEYVWWAQRRGFFRNTLGADRCDLVVGAPVGLERVLTTRPYYRSTYVFAWRASSGRAIGSLDDPALRALRIGVQLAGDDGAATPPGMALARRGIVENVSGFPLTGDYAQPNPPARILDALARGDVDVAAVWGPLAGWYAKRSRERIVIRPVTPARDGAALPMTFAIAMAVRRGDAALRDALDGILARRRADIERILDGHGVPRLEPPDADAASAPAPPERRR